MSKLHFSSILRAFTLSAPLLALACGGDDGDSGDEGASGGATDSAGETGSASSLMTTSATATATATATMPTTTAADTGPMECYGDFSLGEVPFTGEPTLGMACDGDVPMNCADGTFIKFGTGECVCIAKCSSLGKGEGENCIDDGSWVCNHIKATNPGANEATVCVRPDWGLCTA